MALLFDLDNTICASDQDPAAMLAAAFDEAGVEQYCTVPDLAEASDHTEPASDDLDFYRRGLRYVAERTAGADPDDALPVARAYRAQVDHSAVSFVPGAEAALRAARRSDRPVGLVTDGGRATQLTKLESLGIADWFDVRVFGDPDRGLKPDPAPFERALDALDHDPTAATHVGDNLATDVAGANRLGVESVWVRAHAGSRDPDDPEPDHAVDDLTGFPALLD